MSVSKVENHRGFATMIALFMVGMLTLIGLAAMSTSNDEVQIAGNELQELRSFYAAEAGLEVAAATIQLEYENTDAPPKVLPVGHLAYNDCEVAYATRHKSGPDRKVISHGTLSGLHALIRTFETNSVATSSIDHSRMLMTQTFEVALVPIFQFAVFYDDDLEIAPGPPMTLGGRVHSNADVWLQSGNGLQLDSRLTAFERIMHGRKFGGASNGEVTIKNPGTGDVSMKLGAGFLDHTYSNWYDSSVARWHGWVKDKAHGQEKLAVPLEGTVDPHKLIEKGGGNPNSYEHKATLKIVDGVASEWDGSSWNNITGNLIADGVVSYTTDKFMDQREGEWVDVTEIDIEKLYSMGYAPTNGVIYFTDDISSGSEFPGLRLVNGDLLGDGLTIASENPIYVLGDYNTNTKKPSSLLGDAITFLSNSWNDAQSNGLPSARNATTTEVNVAYVTGHVASTATDYSGGVENLPRFLEDWSGVSFNWLGSAVSLWNSGQSDATWGGSYYSPPVRNWVFDSDFKNPDNLPPSTPVVRVFQRTGWEQQFVGFVASDTITTAPTL